MEAVAGLSKNKALGEKHQGLDKFVANIFSIIARGKSSFVKDGTGPEHGSPAVHLNMPKTMFLEPISRLFLGRGNGYMPTQYVIGADTHYVNDFYEDKEGRLVLERLTPEQAKAKNYTHKRGLRTQGYDLKAEYNRSMELGICFEFGQLDVRTYGDDPVLLRFIEEHEQNEGCPRAKDNRDPKRLKLFQFKASIPELEAAKSDNVTKFDADFAAMELVSKTRTKKSGNNGYEYDERRLNAILAVIEDGKTLGSGDVIQKFDLIAQWARHDGAELVRIVEGAFEDTKLDIAQGEQFKVITFGAKEVKFVDGGGKTILELKSGTEKEANIEELMLHLIGTKEGQVHYAEMARLVEVAKLNALNAN